MEMVEVTQADIDLEDEIYWAVELGQGRSGEIIAHHRLTATAALADENAAKDARIAELKAMVFQQGENAATAAQEYAEDMAGMRGRIALLVNLVSRAQIVGCQDLPDAWHADARKALGPTNG